MLAQIRAFSNTIYAKAIMFLLLVAMAAFGVQGVSHMGGIKDTVVEAGGRSINSQKFRHYFDSYKKQIEEQQGQSIPLDELMKANIDGRLAAELASEESVAELITREGVRPSDKLVMDKIGHNPRLIDPITGKFDDKAYKTLLAQNGLTAQDFEGSLRDQQAQSHFGSGLGAGAIAPAIYAALGAAYEQENRTVRFLLLSPQTIGGPVQPSDAQLLAYMKAHADQLVKPESRTITLVRFSAAQIAPTINPRDADLKKRYDFEKDSLSKPELRTVTQLVLQNAAQANEASQRIRSGQSPADVAKVLKVTAPQEVRDTPKSRIADPKVADTAFSLKAGEVSGPIQGALAWAVVKVTGVTPGHEATFSEVRDRLVQEARKAQSADRALELSKKYDDLHSGGTGLVEAAKKVGAQVVQLPAITKDGHTTDGRQLQLPPKFLQAAFNLAKGGETEGVEEAAPGEYYAIRIEDVTPQGPFKLEEVRGPLTQQLVREELVKRLQAKADDLAARVRKGQSLDDVAKSVGAQVNSIKGLSRGDRQAGQSLGGQFMNAVFGSKTGEVATALMPAGVAVLRIETSSPGDTANIARQAQAQRTAIASAISRDFAEATRDAARTLIKPRTDLKRARAAAGGDPDTLNVDPAAAKTTSDPAKPAKRAP